MSPAQALPAEARLALPARDGAIVASVGALAHVAADLPKIEALRREPGPLPGRDLPASFLKHSDEQSVCGFAAILEAIRESGQPIESFREWGVVGAPRYPGRILGGSAMAKFFDQGVRGISPHAIPQISLHSLSGVISVGLGLIGPNVGAGGGANALAEGLTTAFAMLAEQRAPGLWLVVTAWDREPLPQKNGRVVAEGLCHAVALALMPLEAFWSAAIHRRFSISGRAIPRSLEAKCEEAEIDFRTPNGLCLSFEQQTANPIDDLCGVDGCGPDEPPASVMSLAEALSRQSRAALGDVLWRFPLDWGAEVTLAKQHSS